ncbi:MAG: VCBS repeat-containing protein [Acidobacteria bacterium]|nr:VCBS repeat-containing protein [Acidobacteriota bacterium]
MRHTHSHTYQRKHRTPLNTFLLLLCLLALSAGAGRLAPSAHATSEVSPSAAAAANGCSAADFKAPVNLNLGVQQFTAAPSDIALADFNGDGRTDVALLHTGQSGVRPKLLVALDNGAGGYTPVTPITYSFDSPLYRLVAADFNKDGRADLAVVGTLTQPFSHILSISLSNPDGSPGAPTNYTSASMQNPYDLAAADFNNDGNLDLVTVNGGSQNYTILFGNGAGGFTFTAQQAVGTRFDHVAVGDFNGDSKPDLAITDFDDKRLVILRNNDNGVFGVTQTVALNGAPDNVVAGDFNGDGKADLVVANQLTVGGNLPTDDSSVGVLLNDGTGNFNAPAYYKVGATPRDLVTADFDGDSKLDLAVANGSSSNTQAAAVYVLSGDGAGAFSNPAIFNFPGAHTAIAAADLDKDGRTDIAGVISTISSISDVIGVLYGNPPVTLPCLLIDDVAVTEGDSGTTNAIIPVRLSQPSAQEVRVNYQTAGLTATEGPDFTGGTGTLVFAPGETSKDVNVLVKGDVLDELDEFVSVTLTNPVNARLSDPVGKLTIIDDEQQPTISVNDVSVAEGTTGAVTLANFTVSLSAPSGLVVHVDYSGAAGTATAGTDYSIFPNTIFFTPGTTTRTFTVTINGDRTYEPDETFFVNLSNPGDATIADGQGQGTILNDDPLPAVSVLNAVGSEPSSGAGGTATVSVRLSNPSSLPVTVDYATADGTATAGTDYTAASGTLTFAPGETEKTVPLTILDDSVDEVLEEFFFNLSNPTNGTIDDGQAFVQVVDNDGPAISINDVSVTEGQGGRTLATFTLSLSAASPETIVVNARTANGTATSGTPPFDYASANRPVVFNPGATTATFTVFVNGDSVIEPDETFFVNLTAPNGATIADAQGVCTIVNDDVTSVQFASTDISVNESAGSVQATVTRVGDTSGSFTAFYGTFDSAAASERSDYNAAFGTLRFAPGETTKTITVFITDDALVESPETFSIYLVGPENGAVNQPSTVNVTINSEDATNVPNPVNNSAFFVRQHYRDFLNREPDASGLAFWTNEIEQCGADQQCREVKRVNVSAAFFLSIEFQNTGYLVERMYKVAYGDATGTTRITGTPVNIPVPFIHRPDFLFDAAAIREGVVVNVGNWEQRLEANKQAVTLDFVQRPQFRAALPTTLTPAAFVAALNQHAGGVLTQAEVDALVAEFGGVADTSDASKRASVFRKVAENGEFDRRERNRAFVLMQYFGYLQRDPDAAPDFDHTGWKFWLDKLNDFDGNYVSAEMVKAFIQSDEYVKRFGQ